MDKWYPHTRSGRYLRARFRNLVFDYLRLDPIRRRHLQHCWHYVRCAASCLKIGSYREHKVSRWLKCAGINNVEWLSSAYKAGAAANDDDEYHVLVENWCWALSVLDCHGYVQVLLGAYPIGCSIAMYHVANQQTVYIYDTECAWNYSWLRGKNFHGGCKPPMVDFMESMMYFYLSTNRAEWRDHWIANRAAVLNFLWVMREWYLYQNFEHFTQHTSALFFAPWFRPLYLDISDMVPEPDRIRNMTWAEWTSIHDRHVASWEKIREEVGLGFRNGDLMTGRRIHLPQKSRGHQVRLGQLLRQRRPRRGIIDRLKAGIWTR